MEIQGQSHLSAHILVVDDELYMRDLMVKTLGQFGYKTVDTACDGIEGWQALQEVSYDLVITDHKMPKVTGLELIKRMRRQNMLQPVILVSGTLPTEELERSPRLRVDAMLCKPFTTALLLATMEKLLRAADSAAGLNDNQLLKTGEQPAPQAQGQTNSSIRILLVDDDHDQRQLDIDVLTSSGYNVEGVTDGAAGWEALLNYDYDLVITDNHMPKMTGLEMIEKLNSARMTTPVLMATANLPVDEFTRKPWLKPEATLQKPFTNAELLEAVRKVLSPEQRDDNGNITRLPKQL